MVEYLAWLGDWVGSGVAEQQLWSGRILLSETRNEGGLILCSI